jgi:hypothetical protein
MTTPQGARSSSSSSSSSSGSSGEKHKKNEVRVLQVHSNRIVKEAQIVAAFYAGIACHAKGTTDSNTLNSWFLEGFEYAVDLIWKVWVNHTTRDDLPEEQKFAHGFDFNILSAKKVRLVLSTLLAHFTCLSYLIFSGRSCINRFRTSFILFFAHPESAAHY